MSYIINSSILIIFRNYQFLELCKTFEVKWNDTKEHSAKNGEGQMQNF